MSRRPNGEGWADAARRDQQQKPDVTQVEVQVAEGFAVAVDGEQHGGGSLVTVPAVDAARWARRGWVKAPSKKAPAKKSPGKKSPGKK